jgi:hypothetical protein
MQSLLRGTCPTIIYALPVCRAYILPRELEEEVNRWTPFRKTLLHDEREVFDRLVDQAFR